jgi:hypothetical protein
MDQDKSLTMVIDPVALSDYIISEYPEAALL